MTRATIKERVIEVVDFVTTESPYRSATQVWINDYVSFRLGSSPDQSLKEGDELLTMSIYWNTGIRAIIFALGFVVTTLLLAGVSLIAW